MCWFHGSDHGASKMFKKTKSPPLGAGLGDHDLTDIQKIGGGDGDRTHDPFHAMEVLSQLSYAPNF